jgi:hypothetical protein
MPTQLLTGGLLVRIQPEEPSRSGSIPETWVTDHSGDIGNTFGPNGFSIGSGVVPRAVEIQRRLGDILRDVLH